MPGYLPIVLRDNVSAYLGQGDNSVAFYVPLLEYPRLEYPPHMLMLSTSFSASFNRGTKAQPLLADHGKNAANCGWLESRQ